MAKQKLIWKKGKGRLAVLHPLIGTWKAEADSPMGKLICTRSFKPVLGGNYLQLNATWEFKSGIYEELALYSLKDGILKFWSFTSDGKNSEGIFSDAADIHPESICFQAEMPAGTARMIYWPNENGTINWAVESKTKKGWNRFAQHCYSKMQPTT